MILRVDDFAVALENIPKIVFPARWTRSNGKM